MVKRWPRLWQEIWNIGCMALGVIFATIGLKGFLIPSHFIDGGALGVALLLNLLTPVDISILIVLINLPLIFIGYIFFSFAYALRSAVCIALFSLLIFLVDIPQLTSDNILTAFFGGVFLGTGIGLALRGNSVIDGTEILAVFMSRRGFITEGNFVAIFNIVLFLLAVFLIDIQIAMYSILTYFVASKTIDLVSNGIEEYIGVTIVSLKQEQILHLIREDMRHGVTVYLSDGGYLNQNDAPRNVLYCVVTRFEIHRLHKLIEDIDPDAFVVENTLRNVRGGHLKRLPHR